MNAIHNYIFYIMSGNVMCFVINKINDKINVRLNYV